MTANQGNQGGYTGDNHCDEGVLSLADGKGSDDSGSQSGDEGRFPKIGRRFRGHIGLNVGLKIGLKKWVLNNCRESQLAIQATIALQGRKDDRPHLQPRFKLIQSSSHTSSVVF